MLAVNQNMRYDQSVRALKDLLQRGWLGEPVLATIDMRAIPHWMPWAQTAGVAVDVHHEHPPPRHVPLLARHPGPRPGQHPARPAHDASRTRTASICTSWSTTAGCGPRPGTTSGPGRLREGAAPTSASAGASRGPTAWPAARSAGRATPRARPARSTTRTKQQPDTWFRRAGRRSGSPTPSSARWRNCSVPWKTAPSPTSAGATTWRPSLSARPSLPGRRSIA